MVQRLARVLESLATRIEAAEAIDPLADALARTGDALKRRRVRDALSGTAVGHPVHPALVAVPLGAWTTGSLLDATGEHRRSAQLVIGFGVLSSLPAVLTGFSDWLYTGGAERRVGVVHALCNDTAVGLYSASWLARRRDRHRAGVVLAGAGALVAGVGGWLGGHLAYAQGVGVDTTAFQSGPAEWTDVLAEAELPAVGEMKQVRAGAVAMLLVRTSGGVRALADRCTHRGGPLSDGEMQDDCIVCPWHDSAFAVADGAVVRGPATRPQPVYELRIDGGQIQVRRSGEQRALRTNPVGG